MAEIAAQTEQLNKAIKEKAGKYLTFALANEEYGLEILKVREIFGYMDITAIPQTPAYVKGVINLRGQVIPVIDLRAKFGMETTEVTEETCIIVVEITQDDHKFSTGIVVDHVQEVLDIAGENIEESPQFGSSVNTDFILGMGKIGDSVKILLDIDKVLNSDDLVKFAGAAKETAKKAVKETTKATAKDEAKETDVKQEVSTDTSTEKGEA
ncbi:MAG: chemotaxis protein CheW [Planctomycetes bacterium]|nr:chemotaxis protein CheW [Planctomycetota bacterium]